MWHTIALLLIKKQGLSEIVISYADFAGIEPNSLCITTQEFSDGLHLKIMPMAEGIRLVEEERKRNSI